MAKGFIHRGSCSRAVGPPKLLNKDMACKNTDLLTNNLDRQVQACNSERCLSENVYMLFGGNAMSQQDQVVTPLLDYAHLLLLTAELSARSRQPSHVAAMLTFYFRPKNSYPVVLCHLLGGGGGGGTVVLNTRVFGLAFAGVSGCCRHGGVSGSRGTAGRLFAGSAAVPVESMG